MSELEVLDMLNENLRDQVIVYLNGKMMQKTKVFRDFELRFISEITFLFQNVFFSVDDVIIDEGDDTDEMYFISKGSVLVLHRHSHTYINELKNDDYFGEISFFSSNRRAATVKSRGFSETLMLPRDEFLQMLEFYPESKRIYEEKQRAIDDEGRLDTIYVDCYLCGEGGHIALDCSWYSQISGNLRMKGDMLKQTIRRMKSKIRKEISPKEAYRNPVE